MPESDDERIERLEANVRMLKGQVYHLRKSNVVIMDLIAQIAGIAPSEAIQAMRSEHIKQLSELETDLQGENLIEGQ